MWFEPPRKGPISFGGLITSIARALGLDVELASLEPLPSCFLDIHACRYMRLIRAKLDGIYLLMFHNIVINGVVLPCPNRTNVRNNANWIYDLNVEAKSEPMDIPKNVVADGATNDEFYQRERAFLVYDPPSYHSPHIPSSSTHTPHFIDHFACTSSRATHISLDDILSGMHALNSVDVERDNMIHAM